MWKDFFYFTRRERQGILLLVAVVAGIFIGKHFFQSQPEKIEPFVQVTEQKVAAETYQQTLSEPRTYYEQPQPKQTTPPQQQRNTTEKKTYYRDRDSISPSSYNAWTKVEKYPPGTVVEINAADTTELVKIPGIGRSYAVRIVKYRQLLGGYYSLEQLKEVYGMYEELYEKIVPFFSVTTDSLRLIPVNQCSIEKLKSHPYINFYQAKAIVELRKKKGKLEEISELTLFEEFTEDDLKKIGHYLAF